MKNLFLSGLLLFSIGLVSNSSIVKAAAPKGCQFVCSYQVKDKAITITCSINDPYFDCTGQSFYTKVYFGNGDSASWITPPSGFIKSYTYAAYGEYTLQVWIGGTHYEDYAIEINDGTPCDSVLTCMPSFNTQLYYSEKKKVYSISAIRNDGCKNADAYWKVGYIIITDDTLQWQFGNIGEETTISVCSHLQRGCADTLICENILVNRQDAILIDLPADSIPAVKISPNPVYENLQIETSNLLNPIELGVYSLEGRKILTRELNSSAPSAIFSIDLKDFSSGIYFVKVTSGDQYSSVQKIVKQ